MMVMLATIIIVPLQTRISFKHHSTHRPHRSPGSVQREIVAGKKKTHQQASIHRRGLIALLVPSLQMPGIDTAALAEKVANCERTFIIDNTGRLINQLIAKLRYERLNRDFIDGAIYRNARNDVAKGYNLTKLRINTRQAIMQAPEQVNSMPHKRRRVIYRHRATSNHANFWIFERCAQILQRRICRKHISADQYNNRADRLLEKQVDSRGFALALLLNTQSHARLLNHNICDNGDCTVCAATGNNNHFLDAQGRSSLFKDCKDGASNIRLFIVGHNANTASNLFVILPLLPTFMQRANIANHRYTGCHCESFLHGA